MKPFEYILKPVRNCDRMVTDGLIDEHWFYYIHGRVCGRLDSFARFALHNPRAMIRRAIHDRSTICEKLERIVTPNVVGQTIIATPHYLKAVQDFLQKMKTTP